MQKFLLYYFFLLIVVTLICPSFCLFVFVIPFRQLLRSYGQFVFWFETGTNIALLCLGQSPRFLSAQQQGSAGQHHRRRGKYRSEGRNQVGNTDLKVGIKWEIHI